MPIKPKPKPLTAWSYSRLRDWEKCGLFAKLKYIDKVPEGGESKALVRGSAAHQSAAGYAMGRVKKLPDALQLFPKEFAMLRKAKDKAVEDEWCFNRAWQLVEWLADDAWLRMKIDAWVRKIKSKLLIVDHKTGNNRESYERQRRLYALGGFRRFPEVEEIRVELWYLDHGEILGDTAFERSELPELENEFETAAGKMLADRIFAPIPGPQCKWCPYANNKSGHCKFDTSGN